MKILFVHQNFPGQFKHLAPALVAQGHDVRSFTMRKDNIDQWQGVTLIPYQPQRGSSPQIHPWLIDLETKTIRGEAAFQKALTLKKEGYHPDVIVAHPGWGESLFLKEVWPQTQLGIYCEFFYKLEGGDVGFDPEFQNQEDEGAACRLRLKNLNNLMHFEIADGGLSPTQWQASSFPDPFRHRITVVHDGIDTEQIRPNPQVQLNLNNKMQLDRGKEVITFVNRNLEPYRGYHTFMRALPELLARRPKAMVLIIGGNEVSYGAAPPGGKRWRDIFYDEVKGKMPPEALARIRFLGKIPYHHFISVLQLSSVHVYLTYPFVLSWSLLEAMSCGCAIVASDTPPLQEVIQPGENGYLVNFFDPQGLAERVSDLLAQPEERKRLGQAARQFAQAHYDLKAVCLPQQLQWIQALNNGSI